jgi:putative transposase
LSSYPTYLCSIVAAFIIDGTVIQISNQYFWLLMCIEPTNTGLGIYISEERNMVVVKYFIRSFVEKGSKLRLFQLQF